MPAYMPHQLPIETFCPPLRASSRLLTPQFLYRNSFDQPPVQFGLTLPRMIELPVLTGKPPLVMISPVAESRAHPGPHNTPQGWFSLARIIALHCLAIWVW